MLYWCGTCLFVFVIVRRLSAIASDLLSESVALFQQKGQSLLPSPNSLSSLTAWWMLRRT